MNISFENQVALVTGAASGMGLATAQAFSDAGAAVVLTRTAALEYIKKDIRVNAVNPGLIDTQVARDVVGGNEQAYANFAESAPIGRAGRPDEFASSVLWLCSLGASYAVGQAITSVSFLMYRMRPGGMSEKLILRGYRESYR